MKASASRTILVLILVAIVSLSKATGQEIKRIVSLSPSLTMNLYYLDAKDKLVGCTNYCEIAKPDNKPIIATAIKVSLEKLLMLEPDLVIATSITSAETIDMLKKLGIRVEIFRTPESFDEICAQFQRLGSIIGKEKLAKEIIGTSKSRVLELQKLCTWTTAPKLFIQIGAKPLYAAIPNTFMDDYIQFINGTNITADLKRGSITREAVVARDPDVIIIVTMGIAGSEEKEMWENFEEMSAVRKKQVFFIDANLACTPTPKSFVETMEILISLLKKK